MTAFFLRAFVATFVLLCLAGCYKDGSRQMLRDTVPDAGVVVLSVDSESGLHLLTYGEGALVKRGVWIDSRWPKERPLLFSLPRGKDFVLGEKVSDGICLYVLERSKKLPSRPIACIQATEAGDKKSREKGLSFIIVNPSLAPSGRYLALFKGSMKAYTGLAFTGYHVIIDLQSGRLMRTIGESFSERPAWYGSSIFYTASFAENDPVTKPLASAGMKTDYPGPLVSVTMKLDVLTGRQQAIAFGGMRGFRPGTSQLVLSDSMHPKQTGRIFDVKTDEISETAPGLPRNTPSEQAFGFMVDRILLGDLGKVSPSESLAAFLRLSSGGKEVTQLILISGEDPIGRVIHEFEGSRRISRIK